MKTAEEVIKEKYLFYDSNTYGKDIELDGDNIIELMEEYADQFKQVSVEPEVKVQTAEVKMFPMMQSKIYITWEIAEKIYDRYKKLYGDSQSLERIAERGGFGWAEVEEIEKRFNSRLSA